MDSLGLRVIYRELKFEVNKQLEYMRRTNLEHLELVNQSYFADHVDVSRFSIELFLAVVPTIDLKRIGFVLITLRTKYVNH